MDERPPEEPSDRPAGVEPAPADVERELRARVVIEDLDEPRRAPSPPPGAPADGPGPPFRRRASRRVVAGVAGGLADRWGAPALLLRIPLGAAAVVWGLLLLGVVTDEYLTLRPERLGLPPAIWFLSLLAIGAYLLLWVVVPREDVGTSPATRLLARYPGMRSWPGFVLLAIGAALLADRLGIFEPTVVVAFAMIGLGIWLFRLDGREVAPRAGRSSEPGRTPDEASPPAPNVAVHVREPRPPREGSPLGWIASGAALLVVSVAAIWSATAEPTFGPEGASGLTRISTIPALGLLVLAAGLLAGSVFGRARWLILPAVLLVPLVLLTSVIRLPPEGRFGDTYVNPFFPGQLPAGYINAAGKVFVDLNRMQGREEMDDWLLKASSVMGDVTIIVPYDASYRVQAYTGLGSVSFARRYEDGFEVSAWGESISRFEGGPSFVFDLEAGIGNVSVLRNAPTKRELREIRRAEREAA
jgi:phage shock protein PspC (stress-responsive transcriptional regulator)